MMNENHVNPLLFCLSAHFNKVLELRFVGFFRHETPPVYFKKMFFRFRPEGTSDISRWRNHRYWRQWALAPWKGAGPKLWSVALPGLEEFWRLSSGGFSTG